MERREIPIVADLFLKKEVKALMWVGRSGLLYLHLLG